MTVDVIIPIYKPEKELFSLLDKLLNQTVKINNIILINTEEKYFEELTYGSNFSQKYKNVKVYHISKREFDHGKTRRFGVSKSDSDIFVMLTQDAIPKDELLIEKLCSRLNSKVAVSYGRQLPYETSSPEEKISRAFNYPEKSMLKTSQDLDKLGIKTFFCSDVCAAYRRDIYEKLGGFEKKAIFNEDMIYAAGAIDNGFGVYYAAEACVYHSHNYTNKQQFKRNFDLGVSQAKHKEIFGRVSSEGEGKKLVKATLDYYRENHLNKRIPMFMTQCFSKYAGYCLGKNYNKLPLSLIRKCTSNQEYWNM